MSDIRIRPIDPRSEAEIDQSARWMRATLIEVEGEVTGTGLYTMDWLRERVRWHLDPRLSNAAVLVAENSTGRVLGHTILRCEIDDSGEAFGLVSTTYVDPDARRSGIGEKLLQAGHQWFDLQSLERSATWTAEKNEKLIHLYEKFGYSITETGSHETTGTVMVKLEKRL